MMPNITWDATCKKPVESVWSIHAKKLRDKEDYKLIAI